MYTARKRPARAGKTSTARMECDLVRLGHEARRCIERIDAAETPFPRLHWFLGRLLARAKAGLEHGQFRPWLSANGITTSRDWRARKLVAAFDSPDELDGLTLRQALDLAERKLSGDAPDDPRASLYRSLKMIVKKLGAAQEKLEALPDRTSLLPTLDDAERHLALLRRTCLAAPSAPNS